MYKSIHTNLGPDEERAQQKQKLHLAGVMSADGGALKLLYANQPTTGLGVISPKWPSSYNIKHQWLYKVTIINELYEKLRFFNQIYPYVLLQSSSRCMEKLY